MLNWAEALPPSGISFNTFEPKLFQSYVILTKRFILDYFFTHIWHIFHVTSTRCRERVKLAACWMEVEQWISFPPVKVFVEVVYWILDIRHLCIVVKCCLTFEPEHISYTIMNTESVYCFSSCPGHLVLDAEPTINRLFYEKPTFHFSVFIMFLRI